MSKKSITYKDAGVDIKAGEELVNSIKGMVKETHSDAVLSNIGGFGGFFRPDFTGYKKTGICEFCGWCWNQINCGIQSWEIRHRWSMFGESLH